MKVDPAAVVGKKESNTQDENNTGQPLESLHESQIYLITEDNGIP
jgi:hypothetical protein